MSLSNPNTRAHARLSASGAKGWMNCPGRLAMTDLWPERQSSIYADLGTAAHTLGERCLRHDEKPEDWLGHWIGMDGEITETKPAGDLVRSFEVDQDMVAAVTVYVDTVIAEVARLQGSFGLEHRFNLSWLHPDMFGTNDCWVADEILHSELVIIDYKHGAFVAVEVEENEQFMYYGTGLAHDKGWNFDTITMIVVQPRCPHPAGRVRRWTITMEELKDWAYNKLKPAAEAARAACEAVDGIANVDIPHYLFNKGLLKATEAGCAWCEPKPSCPEAARKVQEEARADFAEDASAPMVIEDFGGISAEELGKRSEWLSFIEGWCSSTRREIQARLARGEHVPGWKMVLSAGRRGWRPDLTPEDILKKASELGISPDDMYTKPELITGPAAEKLIRGKGAGVRKKAFNEELLLHNPGSPKIVPESSPGAPIAMLSAADDFKDEEVDFTVYDDN